MWQRGVAQRRRLRFLVMKHYTSTEQTAKLIKLGFDMEEELTQLGKDLVEVFKKHGIEISEGRLDLKTKPLYRKGDNSIVQPVEITFNRLLSYAKSRIDGTYDDIYV